MADPGGRIRPKAVGVFRDGPRVLLSFAVDPDTGERYARLLGGGIELGESAAEALRRELREEIAAEIEPPRLLGVLENLFVRADRQYHEILFVFAARFADRALYDREAIPVDEAVCDGPAEWVDVDRVRRGAVRLYPSELVALIEQASGGAVAPGVSAV